MSLATDGRATAAPASSGQVTCVETDVEQTGAEGMLSRTPSFALPNGSGGSALSPLATVLRWRPPAAPPEEVSIALRRSPVDSRRILFEYLTHTSTLCRRFGSRFSLRATCTCKLRASAACTSTHAPVHITSRWALALE